MVKQTASTLINNASRRDAQGITVPRHRFDDLQTAWPKIIVAVRPRINGWKRVIWNAGTSKPSTFHIG
jgi:hypothetical protein